MQNNQFSSQMQAEVKEFTKYYKESDRGRRREIREILYYKGKVYPATFNSWIRRGFVPASKLELINLLLGTNFEFTPPCLSQQ